jgi:hypothetical protein
MNRAFLEIKLRHVGLPRAIGHYAASGLRRAAGFGAYRVLCLDTGEQIPDAPPIPALEVGLVDERRLRQAARDPGTGLTAQGVAAALARGEVCLGAFVGDVLASHVWITRDLPHPHLQDDVFVRFDPRWGYIRWAFTRPEYRGLRLYGVVKGLALQAELQRGGHGLLSLVEVANFESLRAAERIGCRTIGYAVTTRLANRRVTWTSAGSRAFGVSLVVAAAP